MKMLRATRATGNLVAVEGEVFLSTGGEWKRVLQSTFYGGPIAPTTRGPVILNDPELELLKSIVHLFGLERDWFKWRVLLPYNSRQFRATSTHLTFAEASRVAMRENCKTKVAFDRKLFSPYEEPPLK